MIKFKRTAFVIQTPTPDHPTIILHTDPTTRLTKGEAAVLGRALFRGLPCEWVITNMYDEYDLADREEIRASNQEE